eukprot:CAMPEP_0174854284 /NCGR_PEP_ID=MMETSP1114-20130205/30681_1 /TAXON_ID=312471 /ORGANISM="Neobodo designis, Strain CCAP 1951/1" /LENGTH=77 /DNA_ID=CAMNT_0016088969 /DNA_START=191 /DNA_END=424 /DNA_ORIENTATION=-
MGAGGSTLTNTESGCGGGGAAPFAVARPRADWSLLASSTSHSLAVEKVHCRRWSEIVGVGVVKSDEYVPLRSFACGQ